MTTLHTEVLKPCPFCGGDASASQNDRLTRWAVYCLDCSAEILDELTEDAAIAVWNRRSTPQPDAAAILDKNIVDTVFKYIDRMNDVDPVDPADKIVAEFVAAVMPHIDARIDCYRLSTTLVEPADHIGDANEMIKNFCPDCGQRNNGGLVHTCSPQISAFVAPRTMPNWDAIRSATQDAPSAIGGKS